MHLKEKKAHTNKTSLMESKGHTNTPWESETAEQRILQKTKSTSTHFWEVKVQNNTSRGKA